MSKNRATPKKNPVGKMDVIDLICRRKISIEGRGVRNEPASMKGWHGFIL